VQVCIVHLVRAALKYTTGQDSRGVARDRRTVYQAAAVPRAERGLDCFEEKWGQKYPTIVKPWRLRWPEITAVLAFPAAIRKAIYTTNVIESPSCSRAACRPDRRRPFPSGLTQED
jgi:putative transposase